VGELLRARADTGNKEIAAALAAGLVVPHEVSARVVLEHLRAINRVEKHERWILDGFPRSVSAAACWERIGGAVWRTLGIQIAAENELRARLSARSRADDEDETVVEQRLAQHRAEYPLLRKFYQQRGVWGEVDGSGRLEEAYGRVVLWLDNQLTDDGECGTHSYTPSHAGCGDLLKRK
jgi:adenylate kinase family enzyme